MPSKEYSERTHQVVFSSREECNSWLQAAQKAGLSFGKYILEMARRGREGEAARPAGQELAQDLVRLREENARLRESEEETRKLYERSEAELFKLRNSSYLAPDGYREPSEKLISTLQSAIRPLSNHDLLRALGIDARDMPAMKILLAQLQALKEFGQVQETALGWKWVG
jgi:tyrosyl-tRNA synthetase